MINNSNISPLEQSYTEQATATTSNSYSKQQPNNTATTTIHNCNNKTINSNTKNIQDYQINKQLEIKVFSKMQPGIPSASDFLTLCRSSNQQLAADKLSTMLNKVRHIYIFNWGINYISERADNLPHDDDCLGTPLALAAKYGNTAICKILIEKMKQPQFSWSTKIFINLYDRKLITKYNDTMRCAEAEYLYSAFKKAIKYNNFKTADYIYTVYEPKAYSKNYVTEKLIEKIKDVENIPQLTFLLQKIDIYNMWADCLPYYIVDLATSSAEKNNWELVSYIITNHIDLIKKSSNISIKRFLYETIKNKKFDIALEVIKNTSTHYIFNTIKKSSNISIQRFLYEIIKNKKFDIALEVIKNTSTHYIFNTKEPFIIHDVLADNTLLELINKNCDAETIEWVNNIINSN